MRGLKYLLLLAIFCIVPILITELFLRAAFGFPHGSFNYLLSAKDGLYPRKSTIIMEYGFKPYTVKTNSFGMRGGEIPITKLGDKIRIIALGDSVTDGFFVDNEGTYPYLLQQILNENAKSVEVLNVARGGGSIDKEYALLRVVMPLKPDIVLLTFVNNDIAEILGKSRKELLSMKLRTVPNQLPEWLLTKTAVGELVGDLKLKIKYKNYRFFERNNKTQKKKVWRIEDGEKYDDNVIKFNQVASRLEGMVANEPFSADVNEAIDNYIFALENLRNFCIDNHAMLVFVYFPSYSQIYNMSASLKIRDILREACADLSIPFADLSGTFRGIGRNKVLHFAPLDFHCNAEGNKVIANAVADFLIDRGLLKANSAA